MRLELAMVVFHHSPRRIEALLPAIGLSASGPSLAELRDELSLQVMIRFEAEPVARLSRYQLPPHARIRHVELDEVARDRERGRVAVMQGKVAVLVERWPSDGFWVATPVRLPEARFALADLDALAPALGRTLGQYCLANLVENLEGQSDRAWARLEVLEVDADPPSLLPRAPRPAAPPRRRPPGEPRSSPRTDPESPSEREDRRRRARLSAQALRAACRNLSHGAEDDTLERAFGREAIVEAVTDELVGREGLGLVLVGDSGVGKTAILHEVTRRLHARHTAHATRRDVWRIDGGRFIAGMSYIGQWEARARALGTELVATADILYADDLASLVFAGRSGENDSNLARFLEPHLARGELTLIAESTPERLERVREEAPGFASRFRVVPVPPLDAAATLPVLLGVLRDLESDDSAGPPPRLEPAALLELLDAAARFRPGEAFPGKAVRLLRRVVAGPGEPDGEVRRFRPEHVHQTVHAETGLPPFVLGAEEPRPRRRIEEDLSDLVAGQPEAIAAVTDVVLAAQAGLGDPDKPLATLLLVGPTGVGKTETAKALARYLLGSADRMLRFDMSEFASGASIARLVGEAGGLDGELTAALRAQPVRVVLFDEIEKAHPRVFDALLQLLGEGRLSDAEGRTADARQAILVLTSNLGVREAASQPGFVHAGDTARAHYLSAVRSFFRPEFFNRIDRVVPFGPLDKPALRQVVEHALEDLLSRRGIRRGRVLVDVEPQLLDLLVEQAFDPRYGARPLRRALERRLTVPLAHHLATRRGEEAALVELYRRGDDLGLFVRLLVDAPRLPRRPRPAWTLSSMAEAVAEARTELSRLGALLREDARHGSEADLLEALGSCDAALSALEAEDVEGQGWMHRVTPPTHKERLGQDFGTRQRGAGRGGLRARPRSADVQAEANEPAVVKRVAPRLDELLDLLSLVGYRVRAAATRADDRFTVLCEAVGQVARPAVAAAALTLPIEQLGGEAWLDDGSGRTGRWRSTTRRELDELSGIIPSLDSDAPAPPRRVAIGFRGPGLRELVAPLCGWALLVEERHRGEQVLPVRIELLDGDPPSSVTARDAARDTERAARRQRDGGSEPVVGTPGVVVVRGERLLDPVVHVASGRRTSDIALTLADLAASLSAPSGDREAGR